ncbi:MAG TPA: cell division protein FtsA [Planctomycetota bacterium]|nr:cell division protein FtsA [Planctomycetota bacterium]
MSDDKRRPDIQPGSKAAASLQAAAAAADKPAAPRGPALELGKGLDVGTANLLSAVQDKEGNLYIKLQRNAFIDIDQDDFTRNMLTKLGVQYVILNNRMVVIGDPAFELANIFNRETRRPMQHGMISPKEADALPIEKLLIEKLLGAPQKPGELVYFSVPAEPIDFSMNVTYHKGLFMDLLSKLGYTPKPLVEGHAVVFAELADDDFTGIGISGGGGMFNVCVAYKTIPALTFATSRGGDWIDNNVAQVLGIKSSKACAIKEKGVDITKPRNREEQAIEIYFRELVRYTLGQIKTRFESSEGMPQFPEPVDIVFAGGTPLIGGFIEVVRQELERIKFPIPIKNVRRAEDSLNAIAKGCLVAAMSEA